MAAGVPLLPVLIGAAVGTTAAVGMQMINKPPKPIAPTPAPTRLEARERAERGDILARRRGTGANRRVGFGAGEASTGARRSLLGRV